MQHRYRVVDVFTDTALEGNPLAVFPDSNGIDSNTMQRIARELNLSETVFIGPASRNDCVASFRIFTPARELKFAGHPTVGGSFALLAEGRVANGIEQFQVEEKVGAVPIRIEPGQPPMIWLTTPPIQFRQTFDREACAQVFGLRADDLLPPSPQIVDAGNPMLFVPLESKELVDRCTVDTARLQALHPDRSTPVGLFVFTPTSSGAYSRMFAPDLGVVEDPATGSATGPLAAYMKHHDLLPATNNGRFVSEQGTKMGRRSLLYFDLANADSGIPVGGHVVPIIDAVMTL